MSELRKDPLSGRWVIIAPERGLRPIQFGRRSKFHHKGTPKECPFCPGNEGKTPNEIFAIRDILSPKNSPNWEIRVMPNKYPILRVEEKMVKSGEGIYDKMSGIGAHEIIIETPSHYETIPRMPLERVEKIIFTYRERIRDLKNDIRLKQILIFKNHGEEAGASLSHAHSQLIALPIIPKRIMEEMEGARKYYQFRERCPICDIVAQELEDGKRVVEENEGMVAIEPFSSRFPFEVWIIPKKHSPNFGDVNDKEVKQLAEIYQSILRKMDVALEEPCFNMILHTKPYIEEGSPYYHWHVQIIPQITRIAGFEWGSGIFVNTVPPEEAAEFLRKATWKK